LDTLYVLSRKFDELTIIFLSSECVFDGIDKNTDCGFNTHTLSSLYMIIIGLYFTRRSDQGKEILGVSDVSSLSSERIDKKPF